MKLTDTILTEEKLYLFNIGKYYHSYRLFGAHPLTRDGVPGVRFTVWCPAAEEVCVIGDWDGWEKPGTALSKQGQTGIWMGFLPGAREGALYKYRIVTASGEVLYKADPYAFSSELRPGTASRVARIDGRRWGDRDWMEKRARQTGPMNIYEVHLGSWKRQSAPDGPFLTYRQLAEQLVPYAKDMGYTHLELLPVMEHPLDASWGYQVTGYFAPTSRYGGPRDFMYFIDKAHQAGLSVILDWVPGHFCRDAQGLGRFDGTALYEGGDHPSWGTYRFDFSKSEVRGFLISNALYWMLAYHADGLRVDGVSSMLYLNFGLPEDGPRRKNPDGGEDDPDAVSFLRELNQAVKACVPGAFTIAEESSAWPGVTADTASGGLGFTYKWDMGWMNDSLSYFKTDFPYRPGCHKKLTFSMLYAFSERFVLPLSHDEVVHGKCSLITRMPGGYWRQFAGLRLLALYQITHPGGVLTFMGTEYGPFIEWREYESLEWFLLDYPAHRQHQSFTRALNRLYRDTPALWADDRSWEGFRWLDADDAAQSILLFRRQAERAAEAVTVLLNFLPDVYDGYRVGVPGPGRYQEIFSSDDPAFGGSGRTNPDPLRAEKIPAHGEEWSVAVRVPPIGGLMLQRFQQDGDLPPSGKDTIA